MCPDAQFRSLLYLIALAAFLHRRDRILSDSGRGCLGRCLCAILLCCRFNLIQGLFSAFQEPGKVYTAYLVLARGDAELLTG